MIINNSLKATVGLYAQQGYGTTGKNRPAGDKSRAYGDEVVLSGDARTFSPALSKLMATAGDVRMDRVEELRRRIQDGTYRVSSENLAASILNMKY